MVFSLYATILSYCKAQRSTSFLPFYLAVDLPYECRNYKPQYVAITVKNKWVKSACYTENR